MAQEITAGTRALPRVEEKRVKIISMKRLIYSRFIQHRLAVIGVGVVFFMCFFAYIGPFISPYQPDQVNLRERFAKPSFIMLPAAAGKPVVYNLDAISASKEDDRELKFGHPLGTDDLGRDTMTRAMF